jgi:hypothetical protein
MVINILIQKDLNNQQNAKDGIGNCLQQPGLLSNQLHKSM